MTDYRQIAFPDTMASCKPDPGPEPMLRWLAIADLRVDDRYQRQLSRSNWKVINRIASEFKWSRFSPVFVAPIEGGCYAVIDGQHRTHAALICGIEEVPCQIVPMNTVEQAAAFAAVNGNVTKVTNWQIFRAALAAQEPWAIDLQSVAEDAGCRMMTNTASAESKKPCQIYSVVQMRRLIEQASPPVVRDALKTLAQAEGFNDNSEIWAGNILLPILRAFCQRPRAIRQAGFIQALEGWDVWEAVDSIADEFLRRRRLGLPGASKTELLETRAVDWVDHTFPEQPLLDAPREAAE